MKRAVRAFVIDEPIARTFDPYDYLRILFLLENDDPMILRLH